MSNKIDSSLKLVPNVYDAPNYQEAQYSEKLENDIIKALETPDQFEEWAKTKGSCIIGEPCKSNCCPLAEYLIDTLNLDAVAVGGYITAAIRGNEWAYEVRHPEWARSFISDVDARTEMAQPNVSGNVARRIVRNVRSFLSL